MNKVKLCDFGKKIKKKLVDIDQSQDWLISQVASDTKLYFDSSYLYKIMTGKLATPKIIASICKILELNEQSERAG